MSYDAPFMKACRGEAVPHTPIWLMRQAGRYMKEYRDVREKVSMLELCKTPDLAAEVTVTAVEKIGADAAIIFSDLLLILEPLGLTLEFVQGGGPLIHNPIREAADIDLLKDFSAKEELAFVYEAIKTTRASLKSDTPLIGFAGAPFTLASYMIEGQGSKNYEHTKKLMFSDPGAWHALMEKLRAPIVDYLNSQIAAGAQAVQLFDSWVGCLKPSVYREFVLPHVRHIIENVTPGTPIISFGTGNPELLEVSREAGGSVIGVDYRIDLDVAWERLGDISVQGNLDPCALLADRDSLLARVQIILDQAAGRPGHIFNLGHGILPTTPVDNVIALVDYVHEKTGRN